MITCIRDNTISYEKVSNQRKICQVHYHEEYELYYLINGETKYFVGDEIFHLCEGDFILVPKEILHYTDSEQCLHNERILVNFGEDMIDESAAPILARLSQEKLIYMPSGKRYQAEELLQRLLTEYDEKNEHYSLILKLGITELLILLYRWGNSSRPNLTETDKMMQKISEFIRKNYDTDLSLKLLSQYFSISESHLSRRFKAFAGVGLNEYIKYVRLHHATKLLETTTASITDVSSLCGFNDSNYFANVFKKAKGITPYKYASRFRK